MFAWEYRPNYAIIKVNIHWYCQGWDEGWVEDSRMQNFMVFYLIKNNRQQNLTWLDQQQGTETHEREHSGTTFWNRTIWHKIANTIRINREQTRQIMKENRWGKWTNKQITGRVRLHNRHESTWHKEPDKQAVRKHNEKAHGWCKHEPRATQKTTPHTDRSAYAPSTEVRIHKIKNRIQTHGAWMSEPPTETRPKRWDPNTTLHTQNYLCGQKTIQ